MKIETILYMADQLDAEQNPIAAGGANANAPVAENKPVAQPADNAQRQPIGPIQNANSPGVVVQPVPTTSAPVVKPNIQRMSVERPGVPGSQANQPNTGQTDQRAHKLDDDDDDDDDDEPAQPNQQLMPLLVTAKAATPTANRGQELFVAIILNGSNDISSSHISLSFDSNIIDVKSVRDSGLMRTGGTAADLQFTSEGGLLNIQMEKPQGAPGSPPRGQLCLIVFTVKNPGQSPLTINEQQTFFRTPTGQLLPLKVQSSQVEVR